ncbi:hypothetical protein ACYSNW_12445 [Enterococcus sp. LJL99]
MKIKRVVWTLIGLFLLIVLFFYCHQTPEKAIRMSIFSKGDFSRAFSCKIDQLDTSEGKKIYKVTPPSYEESTNTIFDEYEVSKTRLNYYVAGYYFNN